MHSAVVRSSEADVHDRLSELGLRIHDLIPAVHAYQHAIDSATPNYPPAGPGMVGWVMASTSLRETLCPQGWAANDDGNYSRAVSPDGKMAIVVSSGDEWTGLPHRAPKTRSAKGACAVAAADANRRQLSLFKWDDEKVVQLVPGALTWYLLLFHSDDDIRAEMSLPQYVDDGEKIQYWAERIILPKIPRTNMELTLPGGGDDPGPDFDIDVIPR